METSTSLESLRDMKTASRDISQQLSGYDEQLKIVFGCNYVTLVFLAADNVLFGNSANMPTPLYSSRAVAELQELSSLVCQHSVHVKQAQEEEQLGTSRTRELFCSKQ